MAKHDEFPSLDADKLDTVTGGVTAATTSSQSAFSTLMPMLAFGGGLGKGGTCPCGCGMPASACTMRR